MTGWSSSWSAVGERGDGWVFARQTSRLGHPWSQMQEREQAIAEKRTSTERSRDQAGSRATTDPARAERLRELRDAIREGRYAVSAEDVAERILKDLKCGEKT